MSQISHYQVLGLPKVATADEIRQAFRRMAKQYHPDKNPGSVFHEEYFKQITAAYEVLSDPEARAAYDRTLYWEELGANRSTSSTTARTSQSDTPPYSQRPHNRPDMAYRGARFKYDEEGNLKTDGPSNSGERSSGFQRVGTAAIALACLIMLGIWLADINSQIQASKHLSAGDADAALMLDPDNPLANYQKAKLAAEKGQWDEAYRFITKSKERIEEGSITRDWVGLYAETGLRVGQVDEVIQLLIFYLGSDRSFDLGRLRLAQAYLMKHKHTEASQMAHEVLLSNQNNVEALYVAGISDYEMGRYLDAIPSFNQLLSHEDFSKKVVLQLFDCYLKTQKLTEAKQIIENLPDGKLKKDLSKKLPVQ